MRLLPDHRADLCHPDFLNGHESGVAVRLTRAIADGESIALTGLILTEVLMGLKGSAAGPLQQLFRGFARLRIATGFARFEGALARR